jgi:acetyl-CoA acetyltransferase
MARIHGIAVAGCYEIMGIGPVPAVKKAGAGRVQGCDLN